MEWLEMAAWFAFEGGGDVRMQSPTFELIMADTKASLADPNDKEIIDEALILNYFTVVR
jgi:hypothetical protein